MYRAAKSAAILLGASLLTFAAVVPSPAADSIPRGTVLPVLLNSTMSSAKHRPGQIVTARIMQDVPLPDGRAIRAGSTVIGHITGVTPMSNGSAARLSLRFDTLKAWHRRIAITTNLRAVASLMEVDQAQIPLTGPDRGTSEEAWTTTQIGGDAVYRGGGPVVGEFGDVGKPVNGGVLARLSANPERGCRGAVDANDAPQAVWLFSSDACGTYGLPHLKIAHAGRTDPVGEITFESTKGQAQIHAGAGLLLRVISAGASGA
ncbi:MAG: hypothetical protein WAN23_15700 [Candidatus Acidiferrales bacterium]